MHDSLEPQARRWRGHRRRLATTIAGGYALIGAVWILASDWLAARMVSDPGILVHVQTLKGWGFVLGSAVVFYVVIHAAARRLERTEASRTRAARARITTRSPKGIPMTQRRLPARATLVCALALTACMADRADTRPDPGWQWSSERLVSAVNAVRAGRDLNPATWPSGARVAVLLSFDVDNETVWLRFGDSSIGGLSQGQYGARRGLQRVVDLLDRYEIPASFFIPAMSLVFNPRQADVIKRSGRHEFAVHGWIHEMNTDLSGDVERELLVRAVEQLTEVAGVRPVGYRAPSWNFSPNTLSIIRDLGFMYESSLMADDRPYEIVANGEPTGIVELPVEWILDDAPLLNPRGDRYSPPREVLQVYIDEFDRAYEEGTMFLLTMHPHYIGHRSRIVILERLIEHIRGKRGVWFATHRAAAEYVRQQAGMAPHREVADAR